MPLSELALDVRSVVRRFGAQAAVDNVSLQVKKREFISLLGPSGCGKTTLLRLIAGFLRPDSGLIVCQGKDITDLPPYARNLGVVFQNYALFPHMTAAENVAYGLKIRRVPKSEIATRVKQALDRVNLSNAGDRYPLQLSGGMQQRVALARALVIEPSILLLDEPLSALDKNLREEMQVELRLLQQRVGVTTVFVTHDQEEAMTLSDRVAVMKLGVVLQLGSPQDVYRNPTSRFVATFLGTTNILNSRVIEDYGTGYIIEIGGFSFPVDKGPKNLQIGSMVSIAVRPEAIELSATGDGAPGIVKEILYQGHRNIVLFELKAGGELRCFISPNNLTLNRGEEGFAAWTARDCRILAD